jgi:hypothetical protein
MGRFRQITRIVASNNGASRYSEPVRVNGRPVGGHAYGPAALIDIEVSEDMNDWQSGTARSDGTTALESLQNARFELFEQPKWVRFEVRSDVGGARNFTVIFAVRDDLT